MIVTRIDRLTRFLDIKTERTDENYLKVTAPVAKVGIYTYYNSDGTTTKEFVSAETLKDSASIKTFEMKPVTNDHPDGMVNMDNAKYLTVGSLGQEFSFVGESLIATFIVKDGQAIKDIEDGKVQLSPGYSVDVEVSAGTYNGESYDSIQKNRRYNHLALVDRARGGNTLKIKLDRYDGIQIDDNNNKKGDSIMSDPTPNTVSYRLDGANYTIPVQVEAHLTKLAEKADGLKVDLDAKASELKTVQAKLDVSEEKVAKLEKVDHTAEIQERVDARLKTLSVGKELLGDDFKADMADDAIHAAVITKAFPEFKVDGAEPETLAVRFDCAVDVLKVDKYESGIKKQREDGKKEPKKDAAAIRADKYRNAYKGGK